MEFEELQKSWKAQPIHAAANLDELRSVIADKWQNNQKALFRSNMFMSLGFAAAMIVIGWVYFSFHKEFGWAFKVSIGACYLLMVVFFIVSWKSYNFKKEDLQTTVVQHIDFQLQKLKWQRQTITVFVWIYNLLLWMALMMYILEITSGNGATLLFRGVAMSACTLYIGGVMLATRRTGLKKVKGINLMIAELREIRQAIPAGD